MPYNYNKISILGQNSKVKFLQKKIKNFEKLSKILNFDPKLKSYYNFRALEVKLIL